MLTEINITGHESESRENLISFMLSETFKWNDVYRYSIEVINGNNMITTRYWKYKRNFGISFVFQHLINGVWEDAQDNFIHYAEGKLCDIENVITQEVFDNIQIKMQDLLENHLTTN